MTKPELRFNEEDRVEIGYVADLYELLHAIDVAMPKDATLYLEGARIAPKIKDFLASRQASEQPDVERGTLWPRPETFHLSLEATNLEQLRGLAGHQAEPEICDHLVVYRDREVLLWAHDAGHGYVEVGRSLPPETRDRLHAALGTALRQKS